ncbi:thiamine pyrophosphate-dependent enzyme [Gordonia terrae]|uniref:thiamine pyrophosphate-dependent dehydrogenase E1 component subunit alpha n=1 Tax=Gordonia terrae TaxID=2055 RepID=UPI00200B68FB|nr:thiamine pyrophosphate-dependent enzyme [Gordonia terrae]UPW08065.1 thiamine pyrophosphate-dependent enzyme [Gordonia terrae]
MSVTTLKPPARSTARPTPVTSMIQFVTPQGSLTPQGEAYGVDTELARTMYRDMMLARRFDSEALSLQRQGELNLWLMSWGQEAAQVGSVRALRSSDMIFPSYREHAAALTRGLSPAQLMAQWRGCTHSGWDPSERRVHINSLVLGTQTLHASGYATGVVMDGADEVVTVYFGDGAASQGDVNEAFNWTAAGTLPVLFFCQNNQWAISTPTATQMATPIHRRAEGFGLTTYHVDGNDALAVHAVTAEAAEHIRDGRGPVLIEAQTYRRGGHSSSDDPGRYREPEELALWESRDPLSRLRSLLAAHGADDAFFDSVEAECAAFGVEVRDACRAIETPDLDDVFAHTYAEEHPLVEVERRAHAARREFAGDAA